MSKARSYKFLNVVDDFPILQQSNRGKPLVYLDSAASAQKPKVVIKAMADFYLKDYANIHRGIYQLSARATNLYEQARTKIKQFFSAAPQADVVFVRSTTEGINLVAHTMSATWRTGDEIILSEMEHHSNIVPWYFLKEKLGIVLKVVPIHDDGTLDINTYKALFSSRTKMVAMTHVSNALGTINPITEMTAIARAHDVPILIDGAQAVPHMPVNLKEIDCDFYVFSAHKLYGPSGLGVLYAKNKWLASMSPYQGGGDMIESVSFSNVTYAKGVQKFEAGTPHIAGAIGLHAAINYLETIGMENIYQHEQTLLQYAQPKLLAIDGLRIIGTASHKVGVISMVIQNIHPHDLGTVLDHAGIAVRAGHHCAMPLMQRLGLSSTLRASFGIYNHEADIDALIEGIKDAKQLFN